MSHLHRCVVAVMATFAVLIAIPAMASAKSEDFAVSTSASVKLHVGKAEKAVARLERAVRVGNASAIKRELKRARSQTSAAARGAHKLAYSADTDAERVSATQALTLAGTQYNRLLVASTALVDESRGRSQALIARAIAPSVAGGQRIIARLTSMLGKVPAEVQPVLASIITALSLAETTAVVNLDVALESGNLPSVVGLIVGQALRIATEAVKSTFATVQSILPLVTGVAHAALSTLLATVISTVGTIVPSVLNTATGMIGSVLGALPFVGATATGATGALGGLLGGLLNANANASIGVTATP